MDFEAISRFSLGQIKKVAGYNFKRDFDAYGEHLDGWSEAVEHQARKQKAKLPKKYFIEGNHEYRVVPYLEANPALEGLVEVPNGLGLEARGFEWVPFWSKGDKVKIGHATFIHGAYTNLAHARKHVMAYGTNIFYGHTHDVQCAPAVFRDKGKTIVGQSLGCLCEPQEYMRGKPDNWQQAFGVFFWDEDGFFSYYVPRIHNKGGVAQFIAPDGRRYASAGLK